MNKEKFIELLKSPEKISGNDFAELEDLLKKNPYFQGGHTVLAKGSRLLKKGTSSKVMSRAAIYATDRNIFKQYILNQGKASPVSKSIPIESPPTPAANSNAPVRKAPELLSNTEQDNLIKEIYDNLEQWKTNRDHYLEYDKSHPEDIVIKDVVPGSNESVEKLKSQVAEEVKAEDKAKEVEALEAEMLAYTAEKAKEAEERKQKTSDISEISSSETNSKDISESKKELEKDEITDVSSDPTDDDTQEVNPSSVYKFDAIPEPQELPAELSTPKKEVEEVKQEAADTPEVSSSEPEVKDTIESKKELEKDEITDVSSDQNVDDEVQEVNPSSVYKFDTIPEPQELPAELSTPKKEVEDVKQEAADTPEVSSSESEIEDTVESKKELEKDEITYVSSDPTDEDIQEVNPSSVYKFDAIPEPQELPAELSTPKKEVEEVKQEADEAPEVNSLEPEAKDTTESKKELEKDEITDVSSDPTDDDIQEVNPSSVYKFDTIPEPQELPAELSTPKKKEVEDNEEVEISTDELTEIVDRDTKGEEENTDKISLDNEIEKLENADSSLEKVEEILEEVKEIEGNPEIEAELNTEIDVNAVTEIEEKPKEVKESTQTEESSETNDSNELTDVPVEKGEPEQLDETDAISTKEPETLIKEDVANETQEISKEDVVEDKLDEIDITEPEVTLSDEEPSARETAENSLIDADGNSEETLDEIDKEKKDLKLQPGSAPKAKKFRLSVMKRPINFTKAKKSGSKKSKKNKPAETQKSEPIEKNEPKEETTIVKTDDAQIKDIELSEEIVATKKATTEKDDIINKFLKDEPSITPMTASSKTDITTTNDLARKEINFPGDFATENLASILEMQGKSQRAIETYEKLIIDHPDKKEIYKARIEKLKSNEEPETESKVDTDALFVNFMNNHPDIPVLSWDDLKLIIRDDVVQNDQINKQEFITENIAQILQVLGKTTAAIKVYARLRVQQPEKAEEYDFIIEQLNKDFKRG